MTTTYYNIIDLCIFESMGFVKKKRKNSANYLFFNILNSLRVKYLIFCNVLILVAFLIMNYIQSDFPRNLNKDTIDLSRFSLDRYITLYQL